MITQEQALRDMLEVVPHFKFKSKEEKEKIINDGLKKSKK